jgi:hypothetical protein
MDVNRNDLLAVAVWYVNLVGAKKGYTWWDSPIES